MPRIKKQTEKDDFINNKNEASTKKKSSDTSKSETSTNKLKKVATSETKTSKTKEVDKKKVATKKASDKTPKKTESKKSTTKVSKTKKPEKKSSTRSTTKRTKVTPVKSLLAKSRESKKLKKDKSATAVEYYDLPYRYNQTTVRILAQTPTILFVYWDISDIDRKNFINKYGHNFFYKTKPILLIHNKTKNYSFEVEINDFANSWYLRMQEPNCEYEIELGRRSIEDSSNYIYVSSSNRLSSPNDHVLFEESDFRHVKFKNIKTGHITEKDFGSLRLLTNVGEIYNKKHKVYYFYNKLYKNEVLESNRMFSNPSSGNPTSGMF